MKRLIPFSAVLCVGLLVGLGWMVSHPQKAAAHPVFNDDKDKHDYDRDKDKDKDKDRNCDQDSDKDRDHGDKDRDHKDGDYGHDGDRDHGRGDDKDHHDKDHDDKDHDGNVKVGSYLVTITKYGGTVGGVTERAVITLHRDRTMSSVDSTQGGPASLFSSQLGAWKRKCGGGATGRTLDFTFPSNGINRLDYTFDGDQPKDTIKGEFILTNFAITADPQGSGGTTVGQFEFTGHRIKVP